MVVYIVIFAIIVYWAYRYDYRKASGNYEKTVKIVTFILILLAGLRNDVGSDTHAYEMRFELVPTLSQIIGNPKLLQLTISEQPLWQLLNIICKSIINSFIFFQIVHAIIFNVLMVRFIKGVTNYVLTAILVVYCVRWWAFNFEVLRESLSVVIFLNAVLEFAKSKSILRYAIISLPCIFIHWFSVFVIITTPIYFYVRKKWIIIASLILASALLFFNTDFIDTFFLYTGDYMSGDYMDLMTNYTSGQGQGGMVDSFAGVSLLGFLYLLIPKFILAMLVIYYNKNIDTEDYKTVVVKVLLMSAFWGLAYLKILISYRVLNYLDIIVLTLAVDTLLRNNQSYKKNLLPLYGALLITIFLGVREFVRPSNLDDEIGVSYNSKYIPYTSIFEERDNTRTRVYKGTIERYK